MAICAVVGIASEVTAVEIGDVVPGFGKYAYASHVTVEDGISGEGRGAILLADVAQAVEGISSLDLVATRLGSIYSVSGIIRNERPQQYRPSEPLRRVQVMARR